MPVPARFQYLRADDATPRDMLGSRRCLSSAANSPRDAAGARRSGPASRMNDRCTCQYRREQPRLSIATRDEGGPILPITLLHVETCARFHVMTSESADFPTSLPPDGLVVLVNRTQLRHRQWGCFLARQRTRGATPMKPQRIRIPTLRQLTGKARPADFQRLRSPFSEREITPEDLGTDRALGRPDLVPIVLHAAGARWLRMTRRKVFSGKVR